MLERVLYVTFILCLAVPLPTPAQERAPGPGRETASPARPGEPAGAAAGVKALAVSRAAGAS
jgi:hypothetical protein